MVDKFSHRTNFAQRIYYQNPSQLLLKTPHELHFRLQTMTYGLLERCNDLRHVILMSLEKEIITTCTGIHIHMSQYIYMYTCVFVEVVKINVGSG